jgi:hypothetical protein
LGICKFEMSVGLPSFANTHSFIASRGLFLPSNYDEHSLSDSTQTQAVDASETAPTPAPAQTQAQATDAAQTQTQAQAPAAATAPETQTPDLLSKLFVKLAQSGPELAGKLITQIQNHKPQEPATPPEPSFDETNRALQDLINPENHPITAKDLLALTPHLSNLQKACGHPLDEKSAKLLSHLIAQGPLLNYYIQADAKSQKTIDRLLADVTTISTEPSTKTLEYYQQLKEFKSKLTSALNNYHQARSQANNLPAQLMPSQLQKAERALNKELQSITQKFSGKLHKDDITDIITSLQEAKKQIQENPESKNQLEAWAKKLFSAEGAVAATMFVPMLANLLAGTLGDLPFIGGLIKSVAGITSSLAGSAQGIIQMLNTLNQTKTAQAVAEIQKKQPNSELTPSLAA